MTDPGDVEKDDVKRTVAKLSDVMPRLNAFESKKGKTFVKVAAFGVDRIFNVDYVNKVLSDTPYQLQKVDDGGGAETNRESMNDPEAGGDDDGEVW